MPLLRHAAYGMVLLALPAAAQNSQPADQTIPGLGNFSLPSSRPTPLPTVVPTPLPQTVLPATVPDPTPSSVATPAPTPRSRRPTPVRPTPSPTPTPRPAAPVDIVTMPQPTPVATPTPTPRVPATPAPVPASGAWPWWSLIALLIAGGVVAALLLGRRRRAVAEEVVVADPAPLPVRAPVPAAVPPRRPAVRPAVGLSLNPARAGLNLLSATVEADLVVTNAGDAPVQDIRVRTVLTSAHAGQDAELAAIHAQPIGRPAAPPFALAPGESRTVGVIAALPRDAIRSMTAAGRPIFVPLVAVTCRYSIDGIAAGIAQAFAVGVERPGATKLAPLSLDGPPRTYDNVAARRHG